MNVSGGRWLQYLLDCIIMLSGLQLLLERIFSRVGIFIPKGVTMQQIFNVAVQAGILAGDLLFWLLLCFGILMVFLLWRKEPTVRAVGLLLLALIALVGGGAGKEMVSALVMNIFALLVCAILTRSLVRRRSMMPENWAGLVVNLALVCSLFSSILILIGQELVLDSAANMGSAIFNMGQLLLVGSGLVIFVSTAGNSARGNPMGVLLALVGASLMTGLFLLGFSLDSYTTGTLLQWGIGLNLGLPVLLYAISFWCFLMGLARMFLDGELGNIRAKGIIMLVLAGYHLPFTSDLLAAVLGLTLLTVPELLQREPLQEYFGGQSGGDNLVTAQSN